MSISLRDEYEKLSGETFVETLPITKQKLKKPNLVNGVKSFDDINAEIQRLKSEESNDEIEERIYILEAVRGYSQDDTMSVNGILDYVFTNYNEDDEYNQAAQQVSNWLLGKK